MPDICVKSSQFKTSTGPAAKAPPLRSDSQLRPAGVTLQLSQLSVISCYCAHHRALATLNALMVVNTWKMLNTGHQPIFGNLTLPTG